MPVDITSIEFKDEYTGTGVTGTDFLMGSILDKMYAIVDISVHWESLNIKLQASVAGSSFTRFDTTKWADCEFVVGDEIEISGFGANDGTYTITTMTDTVIGVTPAPANSTTDNSVDVYGTTQITNLDFYYNLIKNSDQAYFTSIVDRETIQKYGNDGVLDSAAGSGTVNLVAETKSFGWVNGSGTIENTGVTNRQQTFRIEHEFKINPYFLYSQLESTEEGLYPPDVFKDDQCLRYVLRIDARPIKYDNDVIHSSVNGTNVKFKIGNNGWFGEFLNGKAPNYTLESITYTENGSGDPMDRVDFSIATDVEIIVNSVHSQFANVGGYYPAGSPIVIGMLYLPLTEARYVNTQRTMDQNFLLDRVVTTVGAASADGEQFGTDYQSITNLTVTYLSASQVRINFTVDYATAIKTLFEGVDENDRHYLIYCTPQDYNASKLIETDRNAVICGIDNCDWNRDDITQASIVGGNVASFEFPETSANGTTDIKAWITDIALTKFSMRIKRESKLQNLVITVQAFNSSTNVKFELDRYSFNFNGLYGLDNEIVVPIIDDKGYKLSDNDERNIILFERNPIIDTVTEQGYDISYPFRLRYEQWRYLQNYDKDFTQNPVQDWAIYSAYPGWEILMYVNYEVYDPTEDYTTAFEHTMEVTAKDQNYSDDGFGNAIATSITMGSLGANLDGSILFDEDTTITITFEGTGDFTVFPAGKTAYYGILYLDIEGTGGTNFVDENSTELAVREDSMWSTQTVLTVVDPTHITLSATLDREKLNKQILRYLPYAKLGFKA